MHLLTSITRHSYSSSLLIFCFRSFIISQIEKGRKLYGVGTQRQMCVLLDRGGRVAVNGRLKSDAPDMAIVPRIAELVGNLRTTLEVTFVLHSLYTQCIVCSRKNIASYVCYSRCFLLYCRPITPTSCTLRRSRPLRGSSRCATAW